MQNIIEVKNLTKRFGDKTVVDEISFAIKKRGLFAFLGQNGAGKTTTINMLIGLLSKNSGEILYDGCADFLTFKHKIGVVFQDNILDELLTTEENLQTFGRLYINSRQKMKERLSEITELLSLNGILKQRFKTLSGGQKRKVEIARALFMSPEILFLDEPTTGLDPKTRAEIWSIINNLKNEKGMTIFLTTHYMEETAAADSIAVIDKGKIIATGSPAELKARYAFDRLLITPKNGDALQKQLLKKGIAWQKTADTYALRLGGEAGCILGAEASVQLLYEIKDNIRFYELIRGSMDDVFLNVVGESLCGGDGDEGQGGGQSGGQSGANINGANINGANINGANIGGANIVGANNGAEASGVTK